MFLSLSRRKHAMCECLRKLDHCSRRFNNQFISIQFIDQLRALKGQQENCTLMNKQYALPKQSLIIAVFRALYTF